MSPGADPCRCELRFDKDTAIVRVQGVLDALSTATLANHVDAAFASHPLMVVVDLAEAHVVGTAAIYVLMEAHRLSRRAAVTLRIVAHGAATDVRPLALMRTTIGFYPNINAALGA